MKCRNPIVIHYVANMKGAIAFYCEVFEVQVLSESPGWSTLDFGAIELALHIAGPDDEDSPIPHAGLNLQVDNIEEIQSAAESRGGKMTELREPNEWVPVRVATFSDPFGNGFELRQEV